MRVKDKVKDKLQLQQTVKDKVEVSRVSKIP